MQDDRLVAPKSVLFEIKKRADELKNWARANTKMFKPHSPELVQVAQKILHRFPDLIHADDPSPMQADPFVVGLAYERSQNTLGDECVVVTDEVFSPGRTRIPRVCQAYQLRYLTIHQMFVAENWEL